MVDLRDYPALRIENQILGFLEKISNVRNIIAEFAN